MGAVAPNDVGSSFGQLAAISAIPGSVVGRYSVPPWTETITTSTSSRNVRTAAMEMSRSHPETPASAPATPLTPVASKARRPMSTFAW